MVHHSKEDAIDERTFEQFVVATYNLEEYWGIQCRFLLFVLGRCGLRPGELTHLKEKHINWRERVIEVPTHVECNCGSCYQSAQQKADVFNRNMMEEVYSSDLLEHEPGGGKVYERLRTREDYIDDMWQPKTDNAVRTVAFDFQPRVEIAVEDFFERFDEWTWSSSAISRRVDRITEEAGYDERFYPHALRATAATYHVYKGVSLIPLQSMFGWANISTAMGYVRRSGKNTAKEVRKAHS